MRRIVNIFRWLPVIWTDQEWDFQYLLDILQKKLEHMLAFWESDIPISGNQQLNAWQIRETLEALRRYSEDNYEREALSRYARNHPNQVTLNEIRRIGTDQEFRQIMDAIDEQKQADFVFVFSSLGENLQNWWD